TRSRWTPRTSASIAWSVTRPPGLRKILASPGRRPTIASGSIRESMHVTIATPAWAMPSKPCMVNRAAYASFAASRSLKSSSAAREVVTPVRLAPQAHEVAALAQPGRSGIGWEHPPSGTAGEGARCEETRNPFPRRDDALHGHRRGRARCLWQQRRLDGPHLVHQPRRWGFGPQRQGPGPDRP